MNLFLQAGLPHRRPTANTGSLLPVNILTFWRGEQNRNPIGKQKTFQNSITNTQFHIYHPQKRIPCGLLEKMARSQEQHPQEVCGGVQLAIFSGTIVLRSPTQFYSVDFLQTKTEVKKCVFYKQRIKVCISSFWQYPETSEPGKSMI